MELDRHTTYLIAPKDTTKELPYGLKQIPVKLEEVLSTGQLKVEVQSFMYNIRLEDFALLGKCYKEKES